MAKETTNDVPMRAVLGDYSNHPLLPGSVFSMLTPAGGLRGQQDLTESELARLNRSSSLDIATQQQEKKRWSEAAGTEILKQETRYLKCFRQLLDRLPDVCKITECEPEPTERLLRSYFSFRMLMEFVEILVPPRRSFEKTDKDGTRDLLEDLHESFRRVTLAAWSVFFPRTDHLLVDLTADFLNDLLDAGRVHPPVGDEAFE